MCSRNSTALVFVAVILAACANNPDARRAELLAPIEPGETAGDEIVCTEEVIVGSHMTRKRCATRRSREEAMRAAQDWIESGGEEGGVTVAK